LTVQTVKIWRWDSASPRANSRALRTCTVFWLTARFCAKLVKDGTATANKIAAMATVTINSTMVNPCEKAKRFIPKLLTVISR
jgi:lambda repressor-like predicted transcriptional regulator